MTNSTNPTGDNFSFVDAEHSVLKVWESSDVFKQSLAQTENGKPYIFYDGPPFATGLPHHGHLVGSILKDAVPRYFTMKGRYVQRRFGWDCHGLPIEWKIEEQYRAKGKNKDDVPIAEFRKECREFAQKWLDIQREEFKRLGVAGDWDDPYTTMAFDAEAAIVREFLSFVKQGLVYCGSAPVMWSPVEQTALAEAEVEYHDKVSTTIHVRFPLRGLRNDGSAIPGSCIGAHVVIWTTTPWTIPANRAICYSPGVSYGLCEVAAMGESGEWRDRAPLAVLSEEEQSRSGAGDPWWRRTRHRPCGVVRLSRLRVRWGRGRRRRGLRTPSRCLRRR